MPPIPKDLEYFFSFPDHRKSLAKVNRMLSKFYNELPAGAAREFDKLYPKIIQKLSTAYIQKFQNPKPEFAFDVFMVTICVATEKKEKIKNQQLLKNTDIVHKKSLEFTQKLLHQKP